METTDLQPSSAQFASEKAPEPGPQEQKMKRIMIGVIIGVRELIEKYQREKVVEVATELKVSPLPEAELFVMPGTALMCARWIA